MTFISLKYAYFLLITLVIYWLIPNRGWRLFVMLAASIRFYAFLQIEYIPLLLIGIVFNYRLAKAIGEPLDWRIANEAWNRRRFLLLWLGIIINISLLLGFKYVPFFLTSIGTFFNLPVALDSARWVNTNVISPLGLSFFCFECVAYLIDVYRGAPAANSLLQFASYKFFFPKLISTNLQKISQKPLFPNHHESSPKIRVFEFGIFPQRILCFSECLAFVLGFEPLCFEV